MPNRIVSAIQGPDLRGLIAFCFATTAIQAIRPTATYRVLELGGGATTVGFIAAGYGALSLFAAVPLGRAIDRHGGYRFYLAGLGLLVGAAVITAGAATPAVLGAGQVVLGLAHVMAAIAFQTITANRRRSNRDRGFARLAVAISIGQLVGPLAGGAILDASLAAPLDRLPETVVVFAFAAILVIAALAIATTMGSDRSDAVTRQATDVAPEVRPTPPWRILRHGGVAPALAVGMAVATTIDLLIAFLPLIGEARGIRPSAVGMILAVRAGAGLTSRLSMTAMLGRFSRRQILVAVLAVSSVALLGIATGPNAWVLGLSAAGAGFFLGLGSPMTMAWLSIATSRRDRGVVLAMRMSGNRMMQVSMPVIAGFLTVVAGSGAIFVVLACGLAPGAVALAMSNVEIP